MRSGWDAVVQVKATDSKSARLPVGLLLIALPFIRPNILGESGATMGLTLALVAAVITVAQDGTRSGFGKGTLIVTGCLLAAASWVLLQAPVTGANAALEAQGGLTLTLTLLSFGLVVKDRLRARMVLRGVVFIVIALCASAAVTLLLGRLGVAYIPLAQFDVGTVPAALYFPFTPTTGVQTAFGIEFPRFAGLGREPGWMSMYAAFAWVVWPLAGRPNWWGRLLLLVGVIAPLSTAGFAIFVVVSAYDLFLRPGPGANLFLGYMRQLTGVLALIAAVAVAVDAPVLGLNAKGIQNIASLEERSFATQMGWEALQRFSLGEPVDYANGSLNLIAAVTQSGWPYFLLVLLALTLPLLRRSARQHAVPPIAVLVLFLVAAQPPGGSIAVYALAVGVFAYADHLANEPGSGLDAALPIRDAALRRG